MMNNISEQSHESRTKMTNELQVLKCCDQWYQKLQTGQVDRDMKLFGTYSIDEMIVNV